jgi:hypothetical protein
VEGLPLCRFGGVCTASLVGAMVVFPLGWVFPWSATEAISVLTFVLAHFAEAASLIHQIMGWLLCLSLKDVLFSL